MSETLNIVTSLFMMAMSLIENFLALSVVELYFPRKRKVDKYLFVIILCMLSSTINTSENPLYSFVLVLALFTYSIFALEDGNELSKLFVSLFAFMVMIFSAFIVILILGWIDPTTIEDLDISSVRLCLETLLTKIIFFILYQTIKVKSHQFHYLKNQWIVFSITSLITVVSIILLYDVLLQQMSLLYLCGGLIMLIMVLYLTFYYYFIVIARTNECLLEKQLEVQILESNRSFSKRILEMNQTSRKLNHDLKHHFLILESYVKANDNESILSYLKMLNNQVQEISVMQTENNAFNNLVNYYIQEMNNNEIEFEHQVSNDCSFLMDTDLAIIFGNLFSNAIEASKKLETNRKIILKVLEQGRVVSILMRNHYDEDSVQLVNGKCITTKPDMEEHGFGLKNIEVAVAKNRGYHEIEVTKEYFGVFICFCIT